jgi:hypothetical protein
MQVTRLVAMMILLRYTFIPYGKLFFFPSLQGNGSEVEPLIKVCPFLVLIIGIGHFLNLYTLNSLTCLSLRVLQSLQVLFPPDNCFWISESVAATYQR